MKKMSLSRRMVRNELFITFGVAIAFIAVMVWSGDSYGASFQPVPNQSFGMHWGMALEDAQKVRTLEKVDEVDKFTIYIDKGFTQADMAGVIMVMYVFMDNRLGGSFMKLHCFNDAEIYFQILTSIYGQPVGMDEEAGIVKWESSGNMIQLDVRSEMLVMGNGIIMEMANKAIIEKSEKESKSSEKDPSVITPDPAPKTES